VTPDVSDARSRAEARFKTRQTTELKARQLVDADIQATRKKTAHLRAQRLAKEGRDGDGREEHTSARKRPSGS